MLRKVTHARGARRRRAEERPSLNSTSRIQCPRFSICRSPRYHSNTCLADAFLRGQVGDGVMRVTGLDPAGRPQAER